MLDMSNMGQTATWPFNKKKITHQSYKPCSRDTERNTHVGHVQHLSNIGQQTIGKAPMTRSRASAKAAGSTFERIIADWLAIYVSDVIDRRVKTGSADKGDIGGIRIKTHRVVMECKNHARLNLAGWYAEATLEKQNDDAALGVICHKRHGNAKPQDQWVTMTLVDFAWLIREANA
jgi:hypothetical protein